MWTWFWYPIEAESVLLTMTPKTHFTQSFTCSLLSGSAPRLTCIMMACRLPLCRRSDGDGLHRVVCKHITIRAVKRRVASKYEWNASLFNSPWCNSSYLIGNIYVTRKYRSIFWILKWTLLSTWNMMCESVCFSIAWYDIPKQEKNKTKKMIDLKQPTVNSIGNFVNELVFKIN